MENRIFKLFKKIFYVSFLMISFAYPFTYCKKNSTTPNTPPNPKENAPQLISPKDGETLDNGRTDGKDLIVWDFEWSGPWWVEYTLQVWRDGSILKPFISTKVRATSYHYESRDYIAYKDRFNWRWKVGYRGLSLYENVPAPWQSSNARSFRVEPVNTDPPSN